jgi:hypothetical protein
MKTIREWLNELPDEIKDRAIRNAEVGGWNALELSSKNEAGALDNAFDWSSTPERYRFWSEWKKWLIHGGPKPLIQPAYACPAAVDHSVDVNEKTESSSSHQYIEALERSNKELKIALLAEVKKAEPLTKRERFAMAAMQSIIQNPHYAKMTNDQVAESSVRQADALIAELKKPKP